MKRKINIYGSLVLFAVLFLGLTACNKPEDVISENELTADEIAMPLAQPLSASSFVINNNFTDLNKRMNIIHRPIISNNNLKTTAVPDTGGDCFDYTWYLVAEVAAPLSDGEPLSATDVRILGDRAYVTYHRQGDVYKGALEIIDITEPAYPTILSYIYFSDTDINTLAVDDNVSDFGERKIWLAGSSFKKGAVLRQVTGRNGIIGTNVFDVPLSKALTDGSISASANGIGYSDKYIYMTSGNSVGGTFQLDRQSLNIIAHEEYSSAKAIALNGSSTGAYQLSLVGGDDAKLNVYNVGTDRSILNSWPLDQIIHQNVVEPYFGKATLAIREGKKIAFISANQEGMIGINVETGVIEYTSPTNMLTTGNTHGLAIDDKFIYMANSDDGLFIGCIPEESGVIEVIEEVQHWDLDETGASANMVQTDGEWVFVAKGGGGLKILRKMAKITIPQAVCDTWDENGAPECIINDENLCEDLLTNFNEALPEGENALENHPSYFMNSNKEIVITKNNTQVSAQFVMANTNFKNTFGYYTYTEGTTPTISSIQNSMEIIFANATGEESGGPLKEGDQLIFGVFPKGTVIGYFLLADGWNGTDVTEGLYTFFTNPTLNVNGQQQSILLYSESCNAILTSFEDVPVSLGDKDFNDLVIKTSISPMSAMNTTDLVKLPTTN